MQNRARWFRWLHRLGVGAVLVLLLSTPVGHPAAAAAVEEALDARQPTVGGPITLSGRVKPLNQGVQLAVDPESGNGLAVWSRNKRRQNFGQIWAAEIIRQDDGSYESRKPFRVSTKSPAQRPTVEFLPEFGFYMIFWDEGARDPERTTKSSRIMSRLYEPADDGTRARPGDLGPEVDMTGNGDVNLSPAVTYLGHTSIFERVVYRWWNPGAGVDASPARLPGRGASKAYSDTTEDKQTLRSAPESYPTGDSRTTPFSRVLATIGCPDGRICFLHFTVDLAASPLLAQFSISCIGLGSLQAVGYTRVDIPAMLPGDSLRNVLGSFRRDASCRPIRLVTPAGAFDVDPETDEVTPVPFPVDPFTALGFFYGTGSAANAPARAVITEGYVYHRFTRGKFEYRELDEDGVPREDEFTKLWKIKRRRLLGMDVAEAGDTVLVAWGEAKNRRGSKSRIRLGWFVPE